MSSPENDFIIVNTKEDVLRERYIAGAELVGKYGFPKLQSIRANLEDVEPVPFNLASKEKHPKNCVCHFFIDDVRFERLWNNPSKYMGILKKFKYVCGPDFTFYDDMPLALQIWQVYRSRALSYCLSQAGLKIIPAVGWGSEKTFDFCFDGLPAHSTLAVSTNGCFSEDGKECYRKGFKEMCRRLEPIQVVVFGSQIDVDIDVDIVYKSSYWQQMSERLKKR
jgi:hypothetical protein